MLKSNFSTILDTTEDPTDEVIIIQDDTTSGPTACLEKALEFSLKVSQTDSFMSSRRFHTSIGPVALEDAKSWLQILDSFHKENIKDFFGKCSKTLEFKEYFLLILGHYQGSHVITSMQLFDILDTFCDSNDQIISSINKIYLKDNFDDNDSNSKDSYSDHSNDEIADEIDINASISCLHSKLNDQLFVKLLCNKSETNTPFNGIVEGKSWLQSVVESEITSVLSPDLFKSYSNNMTSIEIQKSKNIAKTCLSIMIKSKDVFKPDHFFSILYRCPD